MSRENNFEQPHLPETSNNQTGRNKEPDIGRRQFMRKMATYLEAGAVLAASGCAAKGTRYAEVFGCSAFSENNITLGRGMEAGMISPDKGRMIAMAVNRINSGYPALVDSVEIANHAPLGPIASRDINQKTGEKSLVFDHRFLADSQLFDDVAFHEAGHLVYSVAFSRKYYMKNEEARKTVEQMEQLFSKARDLSEKGSPVLSWFLPRQYLSGVPSHLSETLYDSVPNNGEFFAMAFAVKQLHEKDFMKKVATGSEEERKLVADYLKLLPSSAEVRKAIQDRDYYGEKEE